MRRLLSSLIYCSHFKMHIGIARRAVCHAITQRVLKISQSRGQAAARQRSRHISRGIALGCGLLAINLSETHAASALYAIPPPNDTSLMTAPALPPAHFKPRVRVKSPACKNHHRRLYHATQQHRKTQGEILLYYALPATACCGDIWILPQTRCCAQWGAWSSSTYARFQPTADDFMASATNNDDTRSYDYFNATPVDDSVENPG